jgi:hypothetical protein
MEHRDGVFTLQADAGGSKGLGWVAIRLMRSGEVANAIATRGGNFRYSSGLLEEDARRVKEDSNIRHSTIGKCAMH